jgi:hypothetical protein
VENNINACDYFLEQRAVPYIASYQFATRMPCNMVKAIQVEVQGHYFAASCKLIVY